MTPNWEEGSIHQRVWLPLRRILTNWRKHADKKLMKINKGKGKTLYLRQNSAMHQDSLGTDHLESSSAEKGLG